MDQSTRPYAMSTSGLPPPPPPPPPAGFQPAAAAMAARNGSFSGTAGGRGPPPPPPPAGHRSSISVPPPIPASFQHLSSQNQYPPSSSNPAPGPTPSAPPALDIQSPPMLSQRNSVMLMSSGQFAPAHQRSESAMPSQTTAAPNTYMNPSSIDAQRRASSMGNFGTNNLPPNPATPSSTTTASSPADPSSSSSSLATVETPSHSRRPSTIHTAPAMTQIRGEINKIFDEGRLAFQNVKELKDSKSAKKIDPDGRLMKMVNTLWYRFAYLSNAKYLGNGSESMKEAIMLLTVLCEIRQTVIDVYEFHKTMGDKVANITSRHAWLFDTARKMEELVGKVGMKLAQIEGKKVGGGGASTSGNSYVPQLIDAPLALFEDRLANYTYEQQQLLFEECTNLKSLRSQVESYLSNNYEPALVSLFITEAVGKAVGMFLPQKEKRKLYFSTLIGTYSVCRANSWMLLRANHSIDVCKTSSKLSVQTHVGQSSVHAHSSSIDSSAGTSSNPSHVPSIGAAEFMKQQTVTNTSTRALPNEESLRHMYEGIILKGYFQSPNIEDPIVQKMLVWFDLIEGSCGGNISNLFGKKGALYWVVEKAPKVKSADCSLPISDITDILLGKQTKVFQTVLGQKANPGCCVTLVSKGGYSMNFEASSKDSLTSWMSHLTRLTNASGKKMYLDSDAPPPTIPIQPISSQTAGEQGFGVNGAPPNIAQYKAALNSQGASGFSGAAPATPAQQHTVSHFQSPAPSTQPAQVHSPPLLSSTQNPNLSIAATAASNSEPNGGWVRCVAPDGNYYYWHAGKQQSVWVKPEEFVQEPPTPTGRLDISF